MPTAASHFLRRQITGTARLKRLYSSQTSIKEHDVLLLRQHGIKNSKWHLSTPLRPDSRVKLSYGASIPASELIGRQFLDKIKDSTGRNVVLHEPTLASYIIHSERLATPIYPHDANTIVALLDINPSRPGEDEDSDAPPFEIFEAGTGMGSLTLHIARAIHAANPPIPPTLRKALCEARYKSADDPSTSRLDLAPEDQASLDSYLGSRRAILHTLDRNAKHTRSAYQLVRRFRRAQYLPSIDFHVGSVEGYLSDRLAATDQQPFLSRAVLDLPGAHDNADRVIQALLPNGLLILFTPSISQIADFQAWALDTKQPVRLEKVLELPVTTVSDGLNDASGGRQWDVKTVIPRAEQASAGKPVQVMRPKVGDRIGGGGFIAILRRWPVTDEAAEEIIEVSEED